MSWELKNDSFELNQSCSINFISSSLCDRKTPLMKLKSLRRPTQNATISILVFDSFYIRIMVSLGIKEFLVPNAYVALGVSFVFLLK